MNRRNFFIVVLLALTCWACALPSGVRQTEQLNGMHASAYGGDLDSQYHLGLEYSVKGQWPWDYSTGYKWFLTAAERGHADAQYMVGMSKLLGKGTFTDKRGATIFFRKAAEQGQVRAQYQLGLAYLNGAGVAKDKVWGRQWLEQAAWNSHKDAQFILGSLFAGGVGGQVNKAEAWRWLKKSYQNGHKQALIALERLESEMSAAETALGKGLVGQKSNVIDGLFVLPQVRYVQTALNQLGYSAGSEDGQPGPSTRSATADYVRKNRLPRETHVLALVGPLRGRE